MTFINAIILGIVQGLTEFLPISSSAHLRIVSDFLGTGADPGAAFTAIIQLGTETAVIIYFWRDITRIISKWFKALFRRIPQSDQDVRLGWFIILGSIPIVVLGLLFQKDIQTVFRSLWVVAIMLIVFGIVLGIADRFGASKRRLEDLTWPHAIIYGLAQALALIPGVSRSGGTISAGRFLGYDRYAATRYSFLLAIPAVFGSGIYEAYDSIKKNAHAVFTPLETVTATVVAGIVGFAVIAVLMNYITKRSYLPFVIYRIALGVLLVILLLTGVLKPGQ